MLRFALSPTEDMNLGNLRVALFNFIVSKQTGEGFTIRIEDIDKAKTIEGKDTEILDILQLFGITSDTVSYQSENIKRHQRMALQLLQDKRAFNCFCTTETLDAQREVATLAKKPYRYDETCEHLSPEETIDNPNPFSVRIKKPLYAIDLIDKIQGDIHCEPEDIDSFIILRQDKQSTYNFACAVDDMMSAITFVIREEDYLSNTPRQMAVRAALGYTQSIQYAHLPTILNASGKKMCIQDDYFNVKSLLEEGFIPAAIINYLTLLGNKTPKEIFTFEESLKWFSLENLSKSAATFDIDKLRFINREHLKMMEDTELSRYVGFADADIGKAAKVFLKQNSTTKELKAKIGYIFSEKTKCGEWEANVQKIREVLKEAPFFETYQELTKYVAQQTKLKGEPLYKPLHILLTGEAYDDNLSDLYPHIKNYLSEIIR